MSADIQLSNLQRDRYYQDLEKSVPSNINDTNSNSNLNPGSKVRKRQLILCLIAESIISMIIYFNYEQIIEVQSLLAPSLLGASTAALAQSINQYSKKKFSLNRIFKFMVWGLINGCFTVLWIDVLISRFESLIYRIIIDQSIGAPIFQLIFNILNSLWDHGEITKSTKTSYLKSLKYSYCYWPFFSICSFVFIPQNMMFPANCLANLIWNIILSKLT